MKVSVEKPLSATELAHHGVKGMRWGQRKTSQQRTQAIVRARGRQINRFATLATEPNKAKKADLKKAFLNNPDRATALRMTRGEKVTAALIAGVFAPTVVVPAAVGASVGTRFLIRKGIERRQARR